MAAVLIIGAILGYNYYQKIFGKAITKDVVLFVTNSDSLLDIQKEIKDFSINPDSFLWVAAKKKNIKCKTRQIFTKKRNV